MKFLQHIIKYIPISITILLAIYTSYFLLYKSQERNQIKDYNYSLTKNLKDSFNTKYKINENHLEADLDNKKIFLVNDNNQIVNTFEILTIGKPDSYYETPTGNFYIKTKYENKLSTLGDVYMPYAMQFSGNFFIHGVPYYKNGKEVSSGYSGGCIRLRTEDAKEAYNFSNINTKIFIYKKEKVFETNKNIDKQIVENILNILISLEVLNQEKIILYNHKKVQIKDLNYLISKNDQKAINFFIKTVGKDDYENYKKERLGSIGLNNIKSNEDINTFISYIINNKKFILKYF